MNPIINKHLDGSVHREIWKNKYGQFHRDDGPACRIWYSNHCLECEMWYQSDLLHRTDGPAYIEWDKDGNIKQTSWKINGTNISSQIIEIMYVYRLPHWSKWTIDDKLLVKLSLDI